MKKKQERTRLFRVAQIGSRGIPLHSGGVERVIEAVAPRLVASGTNVTVYCTIWSEYKDTNYKGVDLKYIAGIKTKYLDTFVRSFFSTVHAIFSGVDVIHMHSSGSAPLALLARLAGKRVVVTIHGLDWQRRKWNAIGRWFLRMGEWAAVRWPHRTLVVGSGLKTTLDARYGSDVTYIPNGAEQRVQRPLDKAASLGVERRKFVLYLARLVPEKQVHVLIKAWQASAAKGDMKLVIAGPSWHSADYVRELHAMADGDESIRFAGEVDEAVLEELYSNCYAYVLPSEVEGMSLSLLDALAFGACIIVSDIVPNTDVIGDAGLSFAVGDADSLGEVLDAVMLDPAKAEALRVAAKARMDAEYDWDRIAERWSAVYQEVLGRA